MVYCYVVNRSLITCVYVACGLSSVSARHSLKGLSNKSALRALTSQDNESLQYNTRALQECPFGDLACQSSHSQCRPSLVPQPQRCQLAQDNAACTDGDQFIQYLPLWYCTAAVPQWILGIALGVLSLLLFYSMSTIAEHFLVPSVQYMANLLRLPGDIAGVTLFAFATGAPDIFTQLAAINEGEHVDIQLAVSSTLGSGLFIICVVLAVVLLLSKEEVQLTQPGAYIRDAMAYLLACVLTMGVMWDDSLHAHEALLLLGAYVVYLAVCLAMCKFSHAPLRPHGPAYTLVGQHDEEAHAVCTVELCSMEQHHGSAALHRQTSSGLDNASGRHLVPKAPRQSKGADLEMEDKWDSRCEDIVFDLIGSVGGRKRFPTRHLDASTPPAALATDAHLLAPTANLHSFPAYRAPPMPCSLHSDAPAGADSVCTCAALALADSKVPSRKPSKPILDVNTAAAVQKRTPSRQATPRTWFTTWATVVLRSLDELLYLSHSPRWMQPLAVACSPMLLAMHATMPTVALGTYTRKYCLVLSVCAPVLWGVKLGAWRWGPCTWALAWLAATGILLLLLLLTFKAVVDGKAQRANAVLSVLSFLQSMLWMSLLADEVAALFEALGTLWDIQADELGATLLAWGETFPDLVSSIAVVRTGQSMMAIAAAFGGPTLNLLVGTGASVLCAIVRKGTVPAEMTNGIAMLVATSLLVLFTVMAVPALRGWRVVAKLGMVLILLYGVALFLFFLSDSQFVVQRITVAGGVRV